MRIGSGRTQADPIGVVSAVVVNETRPGQTMLGVRRPSVLAPRHPNVLSTPTLRVPAGLFAAITQDLPDPGLSRGIHRLAAPPSAIGRGGHTGSDRSFVLEALFTRKLNLADAIADGTFTADAIPRFLSLEYVEDPLGTEVGEWTAMLTFEVRIQTGVEALPHGTASYSRFVWIDAAKLPQALAHHDALLLDETLDAIEVCVQGLCVRVAVQVLTADPAPARPE